MTRRLYAVTLFINHLMLSTASKEMVLFFFQKVSGLAATTRKLVNNRGAFEEEKTPNRFIIPKNDPKVNMEVNFTKKCSRDGSREKSDQGSTKKSWVWLYGCGNISELWTKRSQFVRLSLLTWNLIFYTSVKKQSSTSFTSFCFVEFIKWLKPHTFLSICWNSQGWGIPNMGVALSVRLDKLDSLKSSTFSVQ